MKCKVQIKGTMALLNEVATLFHIFTSSPKFFSSTTKMGVLTILYISIFIISSVSAGNIYDVNNAGPTREIKVKEGKLIGLKLEPISDFNFKPVEIFLGIPYAAAPTGSQRFMPPASPPPWIGVKLASKFGPVCPQNLPDVNSEKKRNTISEGRANYLKRLLPLLQNQSEDCLYLNIYAPAQQTGSSRVTAKYPVIVFIHGESFEWNSGNPYDGSVLASYGDVIVVTLNFRLGILGFLRPGVGEHRISNFGLLDQIAALQWIKENIHQFGGDPNIVTLMGHGTGAACVNYLMVSPITQGTNGKPGLFHRAILMSGTALADWALTTSSVFTIQVAQALNCPLKETEDEMAKCLRKKRLDEILAVKVEAPEFKTPFGPMVDGYVVPNEPFAIMGAYKNLFSRYDLLYGVTELESYNLLDAVSLQYGMLEKDRDKKIRSYVQQRFEYLPDLYLAETLRTYTDVSRTGAKFSHSVAEMNRDALLDILSDARVTAPMVQTANYHSQANPKSYFYVFSHRNLYGDYAGVRINKSIHGEELPYVFGVPFESGKFPSHHQLNDPELLLSKTIMTFWTNFAKTGNPNAPRQQRFLTQYELEWLEYDILNQTFLSLGISPKLGHRYRQKMMEFWNNHIPDILNNLPPNESANRLDRPEILPPEEPYVKTPIYYNPMRRPENPWNKFPQIPATHKTPVYGTIITKESEKPRSTSTGLLGVDRGFGSDLLGGKPLEKIGAMEPPPDIEAGSSSSMAMSIVIVVGVCLLLVNLCAFAGLYYQRDRLRVQERLMKRRYEDVEPTNNDDVYTKKTKDAETERENVVSLEMSSKKDFTKKKKLPQSGEGIYEAVRSHEKTVDGPQGEDGGEGSFKRWKLSRQCSASTMDPHTKVKEWIAHEIVQRCSPRILRRKKFQEQTNKPIIHKDNSLDTYLEQQSSLVVTPVESHEQIPSSPAMSKPATLATLQRPKVKKVSVAVDATPATRGPSVLKQIPVEQMSKSMEELGVNGCLSATEITLKRPSLKRSETCRESLARSSSSPEDTQRDTVVRRSTANINLQKYPSKSKIKNTGLAISHGHSKSDPVSQAVSYMPPDTPQSNYSQNITPHIVNIHLDTKGPSSSIHTKGLPSKQMKTFPTSGKQGNLKSQISSQTEESVGTADSRHLKDINVTSRDSNSKDEQITPGDPLKNIQRRNFPKVLPDLPSGQELTGLNERETKDIEGELTSVQALSAKRRSLPPTHLVIGLVPPPSNDSGSISQPTTPTSHYHKDNQTQTHLGKVPPPPPPRVSSTLGRKPNNTTPVSPLNYLEASNECTKTRSPVLTSSPHYNQRPEPRVIIKPTSTTPVTRNPNLSHHGRNKQPIPRVTPNTGEDYPLTPTVLHSHHQFSPSTGKVNPVPLNRQPSLRSKQQPETPVPSSSSSLSTQEPSTPPISPAKGSTQFQPQKSLQTQRSDASTSTPPQQSKTSHQQKQPLKKSTETSTSSLLPPEESSSNTGTVRRVKKCSDGKTQTGNNQDTSSSASKGTTVPKSWYAKYNQSFLSKSKDSDS